MPEKYQREIEEILLRTASSTRRERRTSPAGWLWGRFMGGLGDLFRRLSHLLTPEKLLLLSLATFLCTLVARAVMPALTTYFAMAGLLLFISSYALYFKTPGSGENHWRGQVLKHPSARWAWLRRLFRR